MLQNITYLLYKTFVNTVTILSTSRTTNRNLRRSQKKKKKRGCVELLKNIYFITSLCKAYCLHATAKKGFDMLICLFSYLSTSTAPVLPSLFLMTTATHPHTWMSWLVFQWHRARDREKQFLGAYMVLSMEVNVHGCRAWCASINSCISCDRGPCVFLDFTVCMCLWYIQPSKMHRTGSSLTQGKF